MLGSNIDWGQNVYFLHDWIEKHSEARPLYLTYTQSIPLEKLGIDRAGEVPVEPQDGWLLIGVNERFDRTGKYDWLNEYQPVEIIGGGIWVYRIGP